MYLDPTTNLMTATLCGMTFTEDQLRAALASIEDEKQRQADALVRPRVHPSGRYLLLPPALVERIVALRDSLQRDTDFIAVFPDGDVGYDWASTALSKPFVQEFVATS